MLKRVAGLAFLLALLVLAIAPAVAQTSTTGSLQGVVKNEKGAVIPDATVIVSSDALVARQATTVTDKRGQYRFPSLPPGEYVIEVQMEGYGPKRQEGVRVRVGVPLALDMTMYLADVREDVTVTAEAPVISVISNTRSTNFDASYIETKPIPQQFYQVIAAAPGVNLDYTGSSGSAMLAFGGTTESQNAFTMDGVNVADTAAGQHWVLPAIQWFETIEVGGLGANAEYGGYTGGVINGVTKSGGNTLSGSFDIYYQPTSWVDDNTPNNPEDESFKFQSYAVTLGGPIIKDNLWFFISGEYWNQVRTPYYSGYFEENYNFDPPGEKTSDRDIPRVLGKLTWQLNSTNRIMFMTEYDDATNARRGVEEFNWAEASREQTAPGVTFAANWESIVGSDSFFNFKVTGYDGRDDYKPYAGTDLPGRYEQYDGFGWTNAEMQDLNHRHQVTADASWTWFKDALFGKDDSHNFKFGALYEDATSSDLWRRNGGFTYYDYRGYCDFEDLDTPEAFNAYIDDPTDCAQDFIERGYGEYDTHPKYNGLHVYAQDSMRLGRWTINAGLRYGQYKGGWQEGYGTSTVYDVNYLDPRLGLVWDVRGDARTAIKAHWGRFHDKMYTYLFDREASGDAVVPDQDCYWDGEGYNDCDEPTIIAARMGEVEHPYVDEILISAEQQFGKDMMVGVDLIDRRFRNIMAMVNVNDDYELVDTIENELGGAPIPIYDLLSAPEFVLTTNNGAYRDFQSVVLRFDKRRADNWELRASLVWTDLEGNIKKNNGYANEYRDLNGFWNNDGKVEYSWSEWEFKLSGVVDLPANFQLGAQYKYYSGWYWTPYMRVRGLDYNASIGRDIYMLPRGSEQLPDRHLLDLRATWRLPLKKDMALSIGLDVFNALNKGTQIDVYDRYGTYRLSTGTWDYRQDFKQTYQYEQPRRYQASVRFNF